MWREELWGECELRYRDDTPLEIASAEDATMLTHEDFFCAGWKNE